MLPIVLEILKCYFDNYILVVIQFLDLRSCHIPFRFFSNSNPPLWYHIGCLALLQVIIFCTNDKCDKIYVGNISPHTWNFIEEVRPSAIFPLVWFFSLRLSCAFNCTMYTIIVLTRSSIFETVVEHYHIDKCPIYTKLQNLDSQGFGKFVWLFVALLDSTLTRLRHISNLVLFERFLKKK
jgi:hypothetical protein